MKGLIIFLVICILLGGAGYWAYKNYSPLTPTEYFNISISAEYNNRKVVTGYLIETSEGIIEGNTSQSYELERLPNEIIKIYNKNIEDQTFYKDEREINISRDQRIDLKLQKPTEIKIVKENSDNKIILNVTSQDARDTKFCLDWSFAYIFVEAKNYTKIELEDYKNCYDLGDLKGQKKQIEITYSEYKNPSEKDYININLIILEFKGKLDKLVKIK